MFDRSHAQCRSPTDGFFRMTMSSNVTTGTICFLDRSANLLVGVLAAVERIGG